MTNPDTVKILLVDDIPSKLLALTAILDDPSLAVITALSGREALRRLLQEDFAVILLDVNMPDIDGFETAALIRQRHRTESTPIIFITADSDETHARRGYSLGAVDYILAPVIPEVLRAKVGVFVDLYRKNRQLRQQMDERVALASAQAARAAAEQATRRSEFLAEASQILSRSLDHDATVAGLLRLLVPAVGDLAAITILDQQSRPATSDLAWRHQKTSEIRHRRFELRELPPEVAAAVEAAAGSGLPVDSVDVDLERAACGDDRLAPQLRSVAVQCLPLKAREHTLGVLMLAVNRTRSHPLREATLVEDIAGRAAIALDNARLYHEIREGDRRKDEFLAMLGHELRNPLAAMANALECLVCLGHDPESVQSAQGVLSRQLRHMVRLVDDLLDVSRITRGKVVLRKETIDISTAIERAVTAITPALEARGHQLDVVLPDASIYVSADPVRLEQVFVNLLHNAVKYTERGGQIQLLAQRKQSDLVVHIKDNGVGIAPDLQPQIFELFIQGDRSLDRSQGGLGLGLTLVRRLVELHGGQVSVISGGSQQGSTFTVRLPIASVPENRENPVSAPSTLLIEPTASRRILVVDDNIDLANTTSALLRTAGHQVWIANDGLQALEDAVRLEPDAVLIDIGLPGLDGYEIARRLRKMQQFEHALLVALTGYGQEEDRRRSKAAGFDKHLVKPVGFRELQGAFAGETMELNEAISDGVCSGK